VLWCAKRTVHSQPVPPTPEAPLFNFEDPASVRDWSVVKLPGVENDQPSPKIEIVAGKTPTQADGRLLQITFQGGDWPAIGTTKVPVAGNWKKFQTLKATLTVDRPSVAYFRICQGKPDEKGKQPCWEKTMILLPGLNNVTLNIRHGLSMAVIDPAKGDITSFTIGMFRPEKGQILLVGSVRLDPEWPPPKALGWYSPYNHDGYSAAAAREFERTGTLPKFRVLGTDMEVADVSDLAKRLKDKWTKPPAKAIERLEDDFKSEYDKLRRTHPKAVLAILRDGEKGWDPANPDKIYAGWKMVYTNSHGPDGPNKGRENTPKLSDTVEVFMRHRSVLMRPDLSSIPEGAAILAAKLIVTRGSGSREAPEKPNLWVVEPCNRDWDESSANCYIYAKGKHWKGVNGLYYGADPDFWPVFAAHGPAGGGAVSSWDFTEALKFWLDGKHANHGFYLHGDSTDYIKMCTSLAKDIKHRPTVMVIYDPKR
jgi:hypothetical protein